MITVKFEGLDQTLRLLDDTRKKQVPFAASRAINAMARDVQKTMRDELGSKIERPRPYTLNSTFIKYSSKYDLTAIVGLIDQPRGGGHAPAKYLAALLSGGRRRNVGYELALQGMGAMPAGYQVVPGSGAKLDAYGNLNRAQMTELFGALKSSVRNVRVYTGKGKRAYAAGYFVAMPGNPRTAHLEPGVYKRIERGTDSALQPVLLYVKPGDYRKRLDLITKGVAIAQRDFNTHFAREFRAALATAR